MNCPDEISLVRYATDQSDEDEQQQIYEHVIECSDCMIRLSRLLAFNEYLDGLLDSWTLSEYGRAYRRLKIAEALVNFKPAHAAKVREWLERIQKGADEFQMKILVYGEKKLAAAAAILIPQNLNYEFELVGVGAADDIEVQKIKEESGKKLAENDIKEATNILEKALKINPRAVQSATIDLFYENKLIIQLVVDSRQKRAWVVYYPVPDREIPSYALLVSDETAAAMISEFNPIEGTDSLLAEFINFPDGSYSVIWTC